MVFVPFFVGICRSIAQLDSEIPHLENVFLWHMIQIAWFNSGINSSALLLHKFIFYTETALRSD